MRVKTFPIIPLIKPIIPQATVCHITQIPIPNSILETNVISNDSITAAPGPKIKPVIIIMDVTGCTFGIKTKAYLPTIASAAKIANKVNLYGFNYIIPKLGNQKRPYHQALVHTQQHLPLPFLH